MSSSDVGAVSTETHDDEAREVVETIVDVSESGASIIVNDSLRGLVSVTALI